MQSGWNLPNPSAPPQIKRAVVLVEYDGPQMALYVERKRPERRYLAVVSDSDRGGLRWLMAPVDGAAIVALSEGKRTVYEALMVAGALIVDEDNSGRLLNSYVVAPSEIPDFALPERDALMPSLTRGYLRTLPLLTPDEAALTARPCLHLDHTPEGTTVCWRLSDRIIVPVTPKEGDDHNCDAEGCGSMGHVERFSLAALRASRARPED